MADLELMRIVEAILIAADAPVSLDKMASIVSGYGRTDIRDAVAQLNARYTENGHACEVNEVGGGWQLYCRADYAKWVKELHRGRIPTRLSQAALETLAIIAYKQPIVRPEIEGIRGVDSSGVLATLLKRNLVSIVGRAPGMGRALMYGTTREFLRYFGLNSVTDLPRLEEFAEVLGLKPEELALAIEGAEAMAGAGGADEDAGPVTTGDIDAETREAAEDAEPVTTGDVDAETREAAEDAGPVTTGDVDAETREAAEDVAANVAEPDAFPARGTPDSDIVKALDET